jgi:hypothetical protein
MLKLPPRGELDGLRGLSEQEDRALRDAFDRWLKPGARSLDATVVRACHRPGAGLWLLCDCVSASPPPALVPVSSPPMGRQLYSVTVTH